MRGACEGERLTDKGGARYGSEGAMSMVNRGFRSAAVEEISSSTGAARNVVRRRQIPLDAMQSLDEALHTAYAYWQSKRKGGLLPSRGDIDVLEIAKLIKNTHLIDVHSADPKEWCFRLVGSIIPQTWEWGSGRDKLVDCPWPAYKEMLFQDYGTVKATGVAMYHELVITVDWVEYQYARVVVPLADDGRHVDTLMSCVVHRPVPDLDG